MIVLLVLERVAILWFFSKKHSRFLASPKMLCRSKSLLARKLSVFIRCPIFIIYLAGFRGPISTYDCDVTKSRNCQLHALTVRMHEWCQWDFWKVQASNWTVVRRGSHPRANAYSSIPPSKARRLDAKLLEIQRLFCSGTSTDLGLNHSV